MIADMVHVITNLYVYIAAEYYIIMILFNICLIL